MLFTSNVFLFVFLPVVLVATFALRRAVGLRAALGGLVAASLFFYGQANPAFVALIGASIVANFALARRIDAAGDTSGRRRLLAAGVALDLATLGYFKYANFFVANVAAWSDGPLREAALDWEPVVLPIAISFFTFQQIAYLVDTARGRGTTSTLLEYALFVSFFPQLIAGPIVHHRELLPQLRAEGALRASWTDGAVGATIFVLGLFKKTILADGMAGFATPVFEAADAGAIPSALDAWGGALAYAFEIYFDFSGYSDMAIGLARMFGLQLPVNFESPYKAASIIEFWRRWHITLSRFLRDYLYIPLGGNRKGRVRRHANLALTMLLGGLWHGAGWNFVLWGGLHGAFLIVNHLWRAVRPREARTTTGGVRAACVVLTFALTVAAWVPFRADSFDGALRMWTGMLAPAELAAEGDLARWTSIAKHPNGPEHHLRRALTDFERSSWRFWILEPFDVELGGAWWIAACLFVVWALPNTREWMQGYAPGIPTYDRNDARPGGAARRIPRWRPSIAWAIAVAVLAFVSIATLQEGLREFIYFRF